MQDHNAEFRARFVQEFLIDLNASAAYRRAGYQGKNSNVQSSRLMSEPGVQAAIREAMAVRAERVGITADRVLDELALLAFSDLRHYEVDDSGQVILAAGAPEGAHRALQSIKRRSITTTTKEDGTRTVHEVELRLWDKIIPLIRAGRHVDVKGFSDRVEHVGKDGAALGQVITYEIPSNGRERTEG